MFDRAILIVLDSCGIGSMPDAAEFGDDEPADTLGHIDRERPLCVPNLARLGLGNIKPFPHLRAAERPAGAYGMAALASPGKDTTTGHWEMAGIILDRPFPIYPNGFPADVIESFEQAIGRKVLGNVPASGTEIIKELGAEHVRTARPIVYTSADSVFQIAAHEDVIPLAELYRICQIARRLLDGRHRVGRVIARPFTGSEGHFTRTRNRHDYAVPPPQGTLLDRLQQRGVFTCGVGKIYDIFCGRGLDRHLPIGNNADGMEKTLEAMAGQPSGLIFTNLVDFDMLYGHRNDVEGYARAIEEFDAYLERLLAALRPGDLLLLTADHGCDPTTRSTDHTREYAPVLAAGPRVRPGVPLGLRRSLADLGQTVAENFAMHVDAGESFLDDLLL
ncbi:MAG: phosphopentomutase [Acidobacteria bacterium]|nr:phosphopentomutase [Acidobacteriota bacterium]